MQLSECGGGGCSVGVGVGVGEGSGGGDEGCRFPKLEECAHFHYERVQLPRLQLSLQTTMDESLHSQHTSDDETSDWFTLQVTCRDECWLIQRSLENFVMLDDQLHQCIYDRKVSQLPEITHQMQDADDLETTLSSYLERFCSIVDNSLNCGPILNWFQLDNRGHRLLVPSEESRSINTPAVAAAYSIRKYVSQARDELSLEVGDMISVIDMASPGESVWWRGKRGFQVGFFPQHCVHIIGDKVPRNMPLPPPVVGSLAISPIKPVLRKHGKLITFFRSFILNRPSRRRLKQSGILKERVFGCDLGEHLLNSGHDIPMVLKCCAEFIETHGIVDGIYRLSGVTSNIQKLRNAFDEDRIPNLYTDDILQDIHSVASLLKMYFRELPNPLCTYQLYHSFVSAVQGCTSARSKANDNERLLKMREAVQKLPPPHYRTLEYLMRHLARVAKHGCSTGMTTRNVAIVWAPNLLRCEELEVGGVAALQGVGVQAVVTEYLVCYADLIFCDHLPNLPDPMPEIQSALSPKRSRPKSLAISTPTKLLSLEEAQNKHLLNKSDECNYIEVGGGPKTLPKKYHTVIELPAGSRKRNLSKRSPSGWRSFFSKSRNSSHGNLSKNREISSPGVIQTEKSVTESDLTDIKRKLRPVKSAESLTSGQSEPTTCEGDVLGPLHCLIKPSGHNRSVSHDSYFDNLQSSTNNSVGSLLDLSEIQLNFELEESEMRIFSEDESLVSSPKVHREPAPRKVLSRARPEDFSSAANSSNPSPKKQARVVMSPDSLSRKRSRLEDQLSDIQYIDCSTPDNPCTISTTAVIHNEETASLDKVEFPPEGYQPKNKSPRSSNVTNRHSLNFEKPDKPNIPKSRTEMDLGENLKVPGSHSSAFTLNLTPTPQTPNYKPLDNTSTTNTPILSLETSPSTDVTYQNVNRFSESSDNQNPSFGALDNRIYENLESPPKSPSYENVLTTINITYKSPLKARNPDSIYEDIELNPEQVVVPTTAASLPIQEASQPVVELHQYSPISEKTPTESPRSSLETNFDRFVTTCCKNIGDGTNCSENIHNENIGSCSTAQCENIGSSCTTHNASIGNSTIHSENIFFGGGNVQRPADLKLVDKKTDDIKSFDSTADITNLTATYKSIDSLSSTPLTPCDRETCSKKSLISPTDEVSMSEVVQSSFSSTSPQSSSPSRQSNTHSPVISPMNHSNCESPFSRSITPEDNITQNDSSLCLSNINSPSKCASPLSHLVISSRNSHNSNHSLHDSVSVSHSRLSSGDITQKTNHLSAAITQNSSSGSVLPVDSRLSDGDDTQNSVQLYAQGLPFSHSRLSVEDMTQNSHDMENNSLTQKMNESPKRAQNHSRENIARSLSHKEAQNSSHNHLSHSINYSTLPQSQSKKGSQNNLNHSLSYNSPKSGSSSEQICTNESSLLKSLVTNDKRKSCDAEILDENAIYQQVKYFRRSIHEINSLLDFPREEKVVLTKSKSVNNSLDSLQNSETKLMPNLMIQNIAQNNLNVENIPDSTNLIENSVSPTLDVENFDSLEPENVHVYENVEPTRNKNLDTPRSRMHECEPKTLDISPEHVLDIPVCSKCLDPENLEAKKVNVKNLTSKFETKDSKPEKENKPDPKLESKIEKIDTKVVPIESTIKLEPTKIDNNSPATKIKHVYDKKDSLPPCLRAKNAKNSVKTRSLDENAFVTEFGRGNQALQRRKSLDDRTSSYINSKLLVEPQKVSCSTTDVRLDPQKPPKSSIESLTGTEQKLNRERIEKYKEERRNFLREKYRSESFKEDKEKLLSRFKQKSFKTKTDEAEIAKDSLELEKSFLENCQIKPDHVSIDQTAKSHLENQRPIERVSIDQTNTPEYKDKSPEQNLRFKKDDSLFKREDSLVFKKLPLETLSKFEKDGTITKPQSFKKHSPHMERRNRPSLKELSDKILDDSVDESVIYRSGSKEEEFLRHRRGDADSEKKRHTFDLLREREFDSDSHRRVSLESRNPRKEKCSPSYCIKDMKAIFESKSQQ